TNAFTRWKNATTGAQFREATPKVVQRLVVGLGGESVLETGLRLHYTYGSPLIPGSALKGLAAHYCHTEVGSRNPEFLPSGSFGEMLFGANENSGIITFHDAWITPESVSDGHALLADVMTPHHADYYSRKRGAAPSGAEDPVPVSFLSIRGAFR